MVKCSLPVSTTMSSRLSMIFSSTTRQQTGKEDSGLVHTGITVARLLVAPNLCLATPKTVNTLTCTSSCYKPKCLLYWPQFLGKLDSLSNIDYSVIRLLILIHKVDANFYHRCCLQLTYLSSSKHRYFQSLKVLLCAVTEIETQTLHHRQQLVLFHLEHVERSVF